MQTTPYGESPSTAIFALAGAEAAISPIAEGVWMDPGSRSG